MLISGFLKCFTRLIIVSLLKKTFASVKISISFFASFFNLLMILLLPFLSLNSKKFICGNSEQNLRMISFVRSPELSEPIRNSILSEG